MTVECCREVNTAHTHSDSHTCVCVGMHVKTFQHALFGSCSWASLCVKKRTCVTVLFIYYICNCIFSVYSLFCFTCLYFFWQCLLVFFMMGLEEAVWWTCVTPSVAWVWGLNAVEVRQRWSGLVLVSLLLCGLIKSRTCTGLIQPSLHSIRPFQVLWLAHILHSTLSYFRERK